jgi:adenylosuccinate lyase
MRAGVDQTGGLVLSSAVLTDLLRNGVQREKAYRIVQAIANRSASSGEDFRTGLRSEGMDPGTLRPERFLVHHRVIRSRLEALRGLAD